MRSSTNFYLFNLAMADTIIILMGKKVDIASESFYFAKKIKLSSLKEN